MSARMWWDVRLVLLAVVMPILGTSCASLPSNHPATTPTAVALSDEDDFGQLVAQLRGDLNRFVARETARKPAPAAPAPATAAKARESRDSEFAERAKALFSPLNAVLSLRMPVVGITSHNLYDSWGDPRDGGRRSHRGIDIFAPKGTEIVAVADGIITFIGDQPKGGHCVWLTTELGASFYYAHLDRWAPGLYEGMEVKSGELLGYVGNTGNARTTPSHLHFGINQNDEMVNPYPILTRATPIRVASRTPAVGGGAIVGTR